MIAIRGPIPRNDPLAHTRLMQFASRHPLRRRDLNLSNRFEALLIRAVGPDQIQLETVTDVQIPKSYQRQNVTQMENPYVSLGRGRSLSKILQRVQNLRA